ETTGRKVCARLRRETFCYHCYPDLIVWPPPRCSLEDRAEGNALIAFRPAHNFDATGTPTRTREHAEIASNCLLDIGDKPVIGSYLARLRYVGIVRGGNRHGDRVRIAPHIGAVH